MSSKVQKHSFAEFTGSHAILRTQSRTPHGRFEYVHNHGKISLVLRNDGRAKGDKVVQGWQASLWAKSAKCRSMSLQPTVQIIDPICLK